MKALKFIGIPQGQYLNVQDAHQHFRGWVADVRAEDGQLVPEACEEGTEGAYLIDTQGAYFKIHQGDIVPLDAFYNAPWSGDVAATYVARGTAVLIEVADEFDETDNRPSALADETYAAAETDEGD